METQYHELMIILTQHPMVTITAPQLFFVDKGVHYMRVSDNTIDQTVESLMDLSIEDVVALGYRATNCYLDSWRKYLTETNDYVINGHDYRDDTSNLLIVCSFKNGTAHVSTPIFCPHDVMTYPEAARNIVAHMKLKYGYSTRRIGALTNIAKSTVHRWLASHAVFRKAKVRQTRFRKWSDHVRTSLEGILNDNPYVTYDDIKRELKRRLESDGSPCSNGTLHTWLTKHMGISRKRVCGKYTVDNERVQERIASFKQQMIDVNFDDAVSLDETSICFTDHSRYGYTRKGQPLKRKTQPSWGYRIRRMTLLMAVSASRVVHYVIFDGACNTERYVDFIQSLPDDCPRHLLMDNVAFHKSRDVVQAMRERDFVPVYTPPYSPQFNPIELVFAHLKRSMRRFVDHHGCLRTDALHIVCSQIPDAVLWNSFAHCWGLMT
jgi:transposase